MADLYLIRGVPGSGKTTLAETLLESGVVDAHYEADFYMCDREGGYAFDASKLRQCHDLCLGHTSLALSRGLAVAVSNTFTRIWEMQPYLDLGYRTAVIHCEGRFKNVHGVPSEKVEEMRRRFEPYNLGEV